MPSPLGLLFILLGTTIVLLVVILARPSLTATIGGKVLAHGKGFSQRAGNRAGGKRVILPKRFRRATKSRQIIQINANSSRHAGGEAFPSASRG